MSPVHISAAGGGAWHHHWRNRPLSHRHTGGRSRWSCSAAGRYSGSWGAAPTTSACGILCFRRRAHLVCGDAADGFASALRHELLRGRDALGVSLVVDTRDGPGALRVADKLPCEAGRKLAGARVVGLVVLELDFDGSRVRVP